MEKKFKFIIIVCAIILVLYSFLSGYFLQPIYSPTLIVINVYLNEHYHSEFPKIKEDGNNTINNIVDETNIYGKNPKRLNIIADQIVDNFTDIYWPTQQNENYFCNYSNNEGKSEWVWCAPLNGFFWK